MNVTQQNRATLIGSIAILLWASLALLTDFNRSIPTFQLMAMSFFIGFIIIAIKWRCTGQSAGLLFKQPLSRWALCLFGLFGYHFFYFLALRFAPVLQASLIAYLWPLFIVIFSTVLLKKKVKKIFYLGLLFSIIGCWLLIWQKSVVLSMQYIWGYLCAFASALIWSLYSVLSSKGKQVSSDFIGWGCFITAILAFICHLFLEQTLWPLSNEQWIGVTLLGAGPVGIAFVVWDIGVKKGSLPLLGSLSYFTPLLSSLLLIAFTDAFLTQQIIIAAALIILGATIAAKNLN